MQKIKKNPPRCWQHQLCHFQIQPLPAPPPTSMATLASAINEVFSPLFFPGPTDPLTTLLPRSNYDYYTNVRHRGRNEGVKGAETCANLERWWDGTCSPPTTCPPPVCSSFLRFRHSLQPHFPFAEEKNPHVLSSPLLLCARRDGVWIKEEEEERGGRRKKCQLTWNSLLRGRGSSEVLCYGRRRQNPVLS